MGVWVSQQGAWPYLQASPKDAICWLLRFPFTWCQYSAEGCAVVMGLGHLVLSQLESRRRMFDPALTEAYREIRATAGLFASNKYFLSNFCVLNSVPDTMGHTEV